MQTVELLNNFDMRQQSYQFIVRFIRMMAFSSKTQDIERLYYGHMVHCYRRCNIMMQIVVYKTNQREDGILVAFSYFFSTNELFFTEPVSVSLSDVVITTFKKLYHSTTVYDEKTITHLLESGNTDQVSFLHYGKLVEVERQEGRCLSFSMFKGVGRETGTHLSFVFHYAKNELCFEVPDKGALQNLIVSFFKHNFGAIICSKLTVYQQNGIMELSPSLTM